MCAPSCCTTGVWLGGGFWWPPAWADGRALREQAEAEAQAKGQVETLQEQQKQAAEGEGQAPPAPQSTEQKVPSPPGLLSALWGQGDPRPLSERLSEVVVDWVELRGDRPVPQPKVLHLHSPPPLLTAHCSAHGFMGSGTFQRCLGQAATALRVRDGAGKNQCVSICACYYLCRSYSV